LSGETPERARAPARTGVRPGQRPPEPRLPAEAVLLRRALQRTLPEIPCRYLYDERGSALFEAITRLPEYYQTRTELSILERAAPELQRLLDPREYVELGSGSGRKTRVLLDAFTRLQRCVLLDISREVLDDARAALASEYPGLAVSGLLADFVHELPPLGARGRRLITFLAGTIGNLHPAEVPGFLERVAGQMRAGDGLLVGIDLIKDAARLEAAYNDSAGVTAAFNKNALRVVNARFGGDLPLDAFEHRAFYDRERAWIEMRLVARRRVDARLPGLGLELHFQPGDEIRTELSCKYSVESFAAAAHGSGLDIAHTFSDDERLFADVLLVRRPD